MSLWFTALLLLFSAVGDAHSIEDDIAAIQSTYQSFTDLSADFVQETQVVLLGKTITRRGTLRLKKGGKLRIEYESPEKKLYISDGSTLWTFTPFDAASLATFPITNGAIPHEALAFLNGLGKLKQEFRVSPARTTTTSPTNIALHLEPRSTKAQFQSLDTVFNTEHQLITLTITNPSGNVSTYHFTNIRTNTGLSDDSFTLPHDGSKQLAPPRGR